MLVVHPARLFFDERVKTKSIDGPLFAALQIDVWKMPNTPRRFLGLHLVVQTAAGVVHRVFLRLEVFLRASGSAEALTEVI
jgi:hypothetical protein